MSRAVLDASAASLQESAVALVDFRSRLRPRLPVVATCEESEVARQLALDWGVVPLVMSLAENLERMWRDMVRAAREQGSVSSDDLIVLTGRHASPDGEAVHLVIQRVD